MGSIEILLKRILAEEVCGSNRRRTVAAILCVAIGGLAGCSSEDNGNTICSVGQTITCPCGDVVTGQRYCAADRTRYEACVCPNDASVSDATFVRYQPDSSSYTDNSSTAGIGGANGVFDASTDGSRRTGAAGSSSQSRVDASVTAPIDSGARDGRTTTTPPAVDSGTTTPPAVDSGATPPSTDDLEAARQFCVDYINEKRASVSLPPLQRATPQNEACTDQGSQSDSVTYYSTGVPHSSAGQCLGGSQNTCPCLPVGGWGSASLIDAIKGCLDSMWAEGMPPQGREACEADMTGCFQQYGHYLNMTRENSTTVSCGFYRMPQDVSQCIRAGVQEGWWANQDFDMQWRF